MVIRKGLKVGGIREVSELGEDPAINTLSHKPAKDLTDQELAERRKFIIEALKLEENTSLTQKDREEIIKIFLQNFDAVSVDDNDFGRTELLKFHISVPADVVPIRAKCRPLNPKQEEALKEQLDEWLSNGIIEPSMSPWASALFPVAKKDGKIRWCVDFQSLNKHTIADSFPLPSIEANLNKLGKARFYSALDSHGAFHNI